jgi:hypothetical protein
MVKTFGCVEAAGDVEAGDEPLSGVGLVPAELHPSNSIVMVAMARNDLTGRPPRRGFDSTSEPALFNP